MNWKCGSTGIESENVDHDMDKFRALILYAENFELIFVLKNFLEIKDTSLDFDQLPSDLVPQENVQCARANMVFQIFPLVYP